MTWLASDERRLHHRRGDPRRRRPGDGALMASGRPASRSPSDVLPHRPPFLFVDEVTEIVPATSATGRLAPDRRGGLLRRPLSRAAHAARRADGRGPGPARRHRPAVRRALRRQAARSSAASTRPASAARSSPATPWSWRSSSTSWARAPARATARPGSAARWPARPAMLFVIVARSAAGPEPSSGQVRDLPMSSAAR